jgi:GST-like protein
MARPAVERGIAAGADAPNKYNLATDKDAQAVLFGQKAR